MTAAVEQTTTQAPPTASTSATGQQTADRLSVRRMLSKAQVAERMGCSERTLERLVKQGRFPASRRYGRGVVWFESAVEHALGLAEQEQLQWRPAASPPVEVHAPALVHSGEPPEPSSVPDAHELEPAVLQQATRKLRKATSDTKRPKPSGASAQDLAALRLLVHMPTV